MADVLPRSPERLTMEPLAALLLLLTTSTPAPRCFVPADQTAGWKRVTLPDDVPALAAPADLDQFRSGEAALLRPPDNSTAVYTQEDSPGRYSFSFILPADARRLDVSFLEDLQGAKVDAEVHLNGAILPLLSGRRLGGRELSLDWQTPGASQVRVSVHHHLRSRPVARTWRVTREFKPGEQPSAAAFFRAPRSLYFLHPGGGRRVVLCDTPGGVLHLIHEPEGPGAVEEGLTPL